MNLKVMVMNRSKNPCETRHVINAWMSIMVFCVNIFLGCAREDAETARIREIEKDINLKIAEIPKVLERATGAYEFGMSVSSTIAQLPDRERQVKWYRSAVDAALQTEIGHLQLTGQRRSIDSITELCGAIGAGWFKVEKSLEETWNIWLNILEWKKTQITRLEKEYTEIRPKNWAKPIPESLFRRVWGLQGLIKNVKVNLNAEITTRERYFWDDECLMSAECRTNVQRKFEAIIGRPIRTLEQIEEDRKKAAEAFQRAEEAAMSKTNRPPPLILIDGTK